MAFSASNERREQGAKVSNSCSIANLSNEAIGSQGRRKTANYGCARYITPRDTVYALLLSHPAFLPYSVLAPRAANQGFPSPRLQYI